MNLGGELARSAMAYPRFVQRGGLMALALVALLLEACVPEECAVDCDDAPTATQGYLKILDCPAARSNAGYARAPRNPAAPRGFCEISGCDGQFASAFESNETPMTAFDLGELTSSSLNHDETVTADATALATLSEDYLAIESWLTPGDADWFRLSATDPYQARLSILASVGAGVELCVFFEPTEPGTGAIVSCETDGNGPCACGIEVAGLTGCCRAAESEYGSLRFELGTQGQDDSGTVFLRLASLETTDACRDYGATVSIRSLLN